MFDITSSKLLILGIVALLVIGPKDLPGHSVEFREAALSERGMKAMVAAAKAMALTAYDLLTDSAFLAEAQREFNGNNNAREALGRAG